MECAAGLLINNNIYISVLLSVKPRSNIKHGIQHNCWHIFARSRQSPAASIAPDVRNTKSIERYQNGLYAGGQFNMNIAITQIHLVRVQKSIGHSSRLRFTWHDIVWRNVIAFIYLHASALYGIYLLFFGYANPATFAIGEYIIGATLWRTLWHTLWLH